MQASDGDDDAPASVEARPLARPDGCAARLEGDYSVCVRCGLAWLAADPAAPACSPMTIERYRECLIRAIGEKMGSHALVRELHAAGRAADPVYPLRCAMELEAVARLVNRVLSEPRILDILNPNRRRNGND
jgi:hypothetical protein